ncbi:hypothetical protein [Hahella ganghwensis]|uniref:hypothetical protein n=1 Tax=Hahella ganghwensis TaxID=286420 RepID=UPI00036970FC|nr:hypothetical protein [Hahella ganghwensis]
MPVLQAEIKYYLSGGAANSDPAASLGGAKSSVEVDPNTLFDDVSSSEASAGDVEYRCIYVENTNGTDSLVSAAAWISSNTASADTTLDIGLGTSAIDGTEQTVGDEDTAPAGVTFSAPADKASGLSIGDLAAGEHKAIWLRRTVNSSAASSSDTAVPVVGGDTV